MHKQKNSKQTKVRNSAVLAHNQQTKIQSMNFRLDDFVLIAMNGNVGGHKMQMRWKGLFRITSVNSKWEYECEDLINEKKFLIHVNRIKLYVDSKLEVTGAIENNRLS